MPQLPGQPSRKRSSSNASQLISHRRPDWTGATLDEHYPGWLGEALRAKGIDAVALTADRPELRGADDRAVLEAAVAEGRVVVTEDVSTFVVAIALAGPHVGVIYCHHARFPRQGQGLERLRRALVDLAKRPPEGLGQHPIEWWLAVPEAGVDK